MRGISQPSYTKKKVPSVPAVTRAHLNRIGEERIDSAVRTMRRAKRLPHRQHFRKLVLELGLEQ
jgi:hypothetical protein